VILPAPFLNALNLTQDVEMRLEEGRIILEAPVHPRQGWFTTYKVGDEESEWGEVAELSATQDWEW
jgi:antitoxin component of MazEF toxin-antitoxin module